MPETTWATTEEASKSFAEARDFLISSAVDFCANWRTHRIERPPLHDDRNIDTSASRSAAFFLTWDRTFGSEHGVSRRFEMMEGVGEALAEWCDRVRQLSRFQGAGTGRAVSVWAAWYLIPAATFAAFVGLPEVSSQQLRPIHTLWADYLMNRGWRAGRQITARAPHTSIGFLYAPVMHSWHYAVYRCLRYACTEKETENGCGIRIVRGAGDTVS
jgi:hypothetical protein